ncbi:MAG: hypothetical protein FRX48_05352 [Lasallia pustulata]|uniref:Nucleic acid-binding, OB-fold n=1 Tax=Lasallia pustulata TaxID=136370 RepID=A0A5M8PND4_9LECA|nr:MAG: hypothetical protein FRX48_05352 [Lasallia pustulata]
MSGQGVIVLAGAPESSTLKWAEEDLTAPVLPCLSRNEVIASESSFYPPGPVWRSLPMKIEYMLPAPAPAAHEPFWCHGEDPVASSDPNATSFLTTSHKSFTATTSDETECHAPSSEELDEETLSQYYDYSYAVHEDVPSSQILSPQESVETSFSTDTGFSTLLSFDTIASRTDQSVRVVPVSGRLSNLCDIPNAAYLRSITPQTMTVNLIVGVISMPQPRSIKTRRGGRCIELVEMLVGDDTKAGFVFNVWLPSAAAAPGTPDSGDMRSMIKGLRPQDVVLVRNVALDSFREKVYGQSLRKNTTKVDLLFRNAVDRDDDVGAYGAEQLDGADETEAQMAKTKRVRGWVMKFVGAGVRALPMPDSRTAVVHGRRHVGHDMLPPDTQ